MEHSNLFKLVHDCRIESKALVPVALHSIYYPQDTILIASAFNSNYLQTSAIGV
jgi:hypothetical protein